MNVNEIMTNDVSFIGLNASVITAAKAMKDLNVGVIPVVDERKHVVGVITDRDIVLRCVSQNYDTNSVNVDEVMSNRVLLVNPQTDVNEACKIMSRNQIRRLPVVEGEKLVGMLSLADVAVDKRCNCDSSKTLESICQD
jgi:CBS domain-containing protein